MFEGKLRRRGGRLPRTRIRRGRTAVAGRGSRTSECDWSS